VTTWKKKVPFSFASSKGSKKAFQAWTKQKPSLPLTPAHRLARARASMSALHASCSLAAAARNENGGGAFELETEEESERKKELRVVKG
jgi:hypothetical protein